MRTIAAALVLAGTAGAASPRVPTSRSAPPATGRVEETVLLAPSLTARRPRFRIYADPGPGGQPPDPGAVDTAAEMSNVVVYLVPDAGTPAAPPPAPPAVHPTISQSGERFVPHVLAVVRGTTVNFPNEDDVYHNVFSLSGPAAFDLGRYPRGQFRSVTFERAGLVQVFCHIHSDMSAVVLVLDNGFFATPDRDGHFAIADVPAGAYTVVGWHERVTPARRTVRVTAGEAAAVTLDIPLPPAAAQPPAHGP